MSSNLRWTRKVSTQPAAERPHRRAALYARRSSPIGENYSIEGQLSQLREAAQVRGLTVMDEYIDAGLSGATNDRPEYQRLLRDAAAGHFDVVLTWKIDRFSRSCLNLLADLNTLKQNGVAFIATSQGVDTSTPGGEFMITLLGALAQMERTTLAERFALGRERRAASGRYWGPPPYGYRYDGDGHLVPDEVEAPIAKLIFDQYLLPDQSLMTVTAALNSWSIPTRTGKVWGTDRVWRILLSPTYAGDGYVHRIRKDGSYRPTTEWIRVNVPAVVSRDTFNQVQELLTDRRQDQFRPKHTHLLHKLLRCAVCGARMSARSDVRPFRKRQDAKLYGPYGYHWYKCMTDLLARRAQKIGVPPKVCRARTWPARYLEDAVWSHVSALVSTPALLQQAIASYIDDQADMLDLEKAVAVHHSRLVQVRTERRVVISLRARGLITEEDLYEQLEQLDDDTQTIQGCLKEVEAQLAELRTSASELQRATAALQHTDCPPPCAPFPQRQSWLLALVKAVVVHPDGRMVVEWKVRPSATSEAATRAPRFTTAFQLAPIRRYASPSERPARYHLVNFSLYLSEDLRTRLKAQAQSLGVTDSELLRQATLRYLEEANDSPEEVPGPFPYARGFSFPRQVAADVEERARGWDRPVTVILRAALVRYMDQHAPPPSPVPSE